MTPMPTATPTATAPPYPAHPVWPTPPPPDTGPDYGPGALLPKVVDITAGQPARITGTPVQADPPLLGQGYLLTVFPDGEWGSPALLAIPAPDPNLPVFFLTPAQTSSLATILVANKPCSYDNTSAQTTSATTGWYRIQAAGTDPTTTEPTVLPAGHGPLVLRLPTTLTRPRPTTYYPPAQGCGCGGNVYNALPCGCGGCGSTPCDHPPVPNPNDCNVLTQRVRFMGTYLGEYNPALEPYHQFSVVTYNGKNYTRLCPDGYGPLPPMPTPN